MKKLFNAIAIIAALFSTVATAYTHNVQAAFAWAIVTVYFISDYHRQDEHR